MKTPLSLTLRLRHTKSRCKFLSGIIPYYILIKWESKTKQLQAFHLFHGNFFFLKTFSDKKIYCEFHETSSPNII